MRSYIAISHFDQVLKIIDIIKCLQDTQKEETNVHFYLM